MPSSVNSTEQRRRLVRRLMSGGRGFAEEYGFPVTNNPSSLFQLLYLSVLLQRTRDFQRAAATARDLRDRGWDSAARMAASSHEARARALREAGWRDVDQLASVLGDLALAVAQRYRGDLRRLRSPAAYESQRERELLTTLPGVDNGVADLFLREVQALWPEVVPVADRRALAAARKLGLGRSARDLAELIGWRESERLAWLVGALARVDLENRYAQVRT